jgi:RHS repeat-associated protein
VIGLEALEDRLMLSTVRWINSGGGDWDTPSNWSEGALPGAGDDVIIERPGITVTHSNAVTDSIRSLTSQASITLSGSSLSIAAESTIQGDLSLTNAATLAGPGDLTVTGTLTLSDATMKGRGTTTVAPGGRLNLSGNAILDGHTLANAGTATWSAGSIVLFNDAVLDNLARATFTLTDDLQLYPVHDANGLLGANVFDNAGTLTKAGGTAYADFWDINFRNEGVVQVQSGTFRLQTSGEGGSVSAGDSTGDFEVAAGAGLDFSASHTLGPSSRVSGTGTVTFGGRRVDLAGTYDITGEGITRFTVGRADFTGPVTSLGSRVVLTGGTADFSTGAPVTMPILDLAAGTLAGSDVVTITDTLNATAGEMAGLGTTFVPAGGHLNLSGTLTLDGRTLANGGTADWSGNGQFDRISMGNGATIDNQSSGTFTIANDRPLSSFFGGLIPSFRNEGTLVKAGATDVTRFDGVPLHNAGTLRVDSGTLALDSLSVESDGILLGQPGTTLTVGELTGDTRNVDRFDPPPTVLITDFLGSGDPQPLEVMSRDLGATPAGFVHNFAYGTLVVSDYWFRGSVRLLDTADNSPGADPEALYVDTLIVRPGCTLDLNGLHVYARNTQISGTARGGSITVVPDGGPIGLNATESGTIAAAGEVDDWTFFGRLGQFVALTVHPGAAGQPAPMAPPLNFARVTLLDAAGRVLATAESSQSAADAAIAPLGLPADGVYHIKVQASANQPASTGPYVLSTVGTTARESPLPLGQQVIGRLDTPISVDRWTFSAAAGQQVQFHLVAASSPDIEFELTGPGGFVGFTGLAADSAPLELTAAGSYTLTVHSPTGQTGGYAFTMQASPIDLTTGVPFSGILVGDGQTQIFRVQVPAAKAMQVVLIDPRGGDRNEVYVKFGVPPTRSDVQYRSADPASALQRVTVPLAAAGTWYVLVYSEAVLASGPFTLLATTSTSYLTGVTPSRTSDTTATTLTVSGAGFDDATTVDLVAGDGTVVHPGGVSLVSPTQLTANFDDGAVPAGVYSVRATGSNGDSVTLAAALTVVRGGVGMLKTNLVVPKALSSHHPGEIDIEYSNTGDAPMPAPLLVLTATQGNNQGAILTLDRSRVVTGSWNAAFPDGFANSIQVLAGGAIAGLLQPGESVRVPVYWVGWLQSLLDPGAPFDFHLGVLRPDDPTPIEWNDLRESLRPPAIAADAWAALYPNLVARLGPTWGDYLSRLDADAAYLGSLGERVVDPNILFAFEFRQADGLGALARPVTAVDAMVPAPGLAITMSRDYTNSISGRYELGPFGQGWSWAGGWLRRLSVLADGTVVIAQSGGSTRRFQPDLRGGYFDEHGEPAALVSLGGAFTLREENGLLTAFRTDGRLDYVEDTNGNRISAGYTGDLLTSLTHSSGQMLQIAYDGGRITSTTDPATGRTTRYAYDAENEHLVSVTTFDGRTTAYRYSVGAGATTEHALLSVGYADGTHRFFAYDAQGRLADAHRDGGAEDVTFTYRNGSAVIATDAAGGATVSSFDDLGRVVKVEDPLHRVTRLSFTEMHLTAVTDAAGQSYSFQYDAKGNLLRATDPLGHTVSFGHAGPFDRLTSSTDQNGHTTRYGYDAAGNGVSTTYADGSVERMAYDALGNPTTLTNRRGHPVQFKYDTSGRVISQTFADGTAITYSYDPRGNLESATDPSGTTSLFYDANDQLVRINYPGGRFLSYSSDAGGRRTQMVDQTGFTVNYAYDAAGRLASLTDGSGAPIIRYSFDAAGRLRREDKGNGTATTYEYDSAGEMLSLVNLAPDGSVNSRFDYTYDALGQQTSMTTLDGQWTYTYDAIGELTHAVFASNDPAAVPDQDLVYEYDDAGNRVRTVFNSITTDYASNDLNQYTTIGSARLSYDADGNLVSRTGGNQTLTYEYDDENRLVAAIAPAGRFESQYDALGNRIATSKDGQPIQYLFDPTGAGDMIAEYDSGTGAIVHFTHGAGLVSRVGASGSPSYYDFDALGSTAGITGPSGRYQNQYSYLPDGGLLAGQEFLANPFQFIGQFGAMQDGNGLIAMRAREYGPADGRFTSSDPIGLSGGDANLYRYADNNPITQLDPWGTRPISGSGGRGDPLEAGVAAGARSPAGLFLMVGILLVHLATKAENCPDKIDLPDWADTKPGVPRPDTEPNRNVPPRRPGRPGSGTTQPGSPPFRGRPPIRGGRGGNWDGDDAPTEPIELPTEPGTQPPGPTLPPEPTTDLMAWPVPGAQCLVPPISQPDPKFTPIGNAGSGAARSSDPNDKIGPAGFGPAGFITPDSTFPYRIDFENEPTATAPAQRVVVTDQLDASLDWNTLQLTGVGFGDTDIAIPTGTRHFQTTVDITENGEHIEVEIELGLNSQTGLITATFQTVDPLTQLPPDVLTGFLPPENNTGRGKGFFTYIIRPKPGVPTGTQIRNVALITFDSNEPISTDQVDPHDPTKGVDLAKQALNTIDVGAPTSSVAPLPVIETATSFIVSWSGQDDPGGSGIASYDVYVSADGGPFLPFLQAITHTSATFQGTDGHTYRFACAATDNVGHAEAIPAAAQATTRVEIPSPTPKPPPTPEAPIANPVPPIRAGVSVTGSGRINSPRGAFPADPALAGKLTFSLRANYAPTGGAPSGHLAWRFKSAHLRFQSTALNSLELSGGTLVLQGTGMLNRMRPCSFLVSSSRGARRAVRLRIRIWDKATGAILYDSQPGASVQAAPITPVVAGRIALHFTPRHG